jgi:hypothetical protein
MIDRSHPMRTHFVSSIALVALSTAMLALVATPAPNARAQSTLEVPGPAQQNQPYIPPRQVPPPWPTTPEGSDVGNGNTIQLLPPQFFQPQPQPAPPPPQAAQPSVEPPSYMAPMVNQPVLPAVFRGCWRGEVDQLDWIRREPGGHKVGFWTPKTYRLCYKRIGNQPFKLTFSETGVEPNEKIIHPHGNVVPVRTDGRAYASMLAQLHFDEYGNGRDSYAPTFAVDETTHLDCRIGGDDMIVSADVYGTRDGEPWFKAHWRADFHHFAE